MKPLVVVIATLFIIGFLAFTSRNTAPMSPQAALSFSLSSSAFEQNERIPSQYTCDSKNVSPPLTFANVPEGATSLALIMDDPDVPKALRLDGVFDHWVVFNMPPPPAGGTREIREGEPAPGVAGVNGTGANAYTGPCPPSQYEPSEHRYIFRLYALDAALALSEGVTKKEVLTAMEGHTLGIAELIGRYSRK